MAFVQTEITAEMIADAMNDDAHFALEMWETLAEYLNMGLMADNLGDLVSDMNASKAKWIFSQFREAFDRIENIHLSDG